ncbi:MAG: hypothetical protein VXZ82_01585 [Planctomycetota bacterium]|nr:hypothetical protein [Planctomycetota bacterium]
MKKEEISFEVGGRVEWVLEPGKYVEVRLPGTDKDSDALDDDRQLAQLYPGDHEAAKQREQAAFDVAELNLEAAQIQLTEHYKPTRIQLGQIGS